VVTSVAPAVAVPVATPQRSLSLTLSTLFVLLLPTLGAIAGVVTLVLGQVRPIHVGLFLSGFVLTGLGITVGYHRLATHRSFDTSPLLKGLLLGFGSMAAEGPVVPWVANHLQHHATADGPLDPHSPRDGFLHAHWGWLFAPSRADAFAARIRRDPVAVAVSATFPIWVAAGYLVPFLVAGWEGFIWGGLLRQFAVHNVTFAVNSVCHRYGSRPYPTRDLSTNNWLVALLGLGEGWHNNHHAFPWSAFHGLRWWQVDLSAYVIRGLELLRLVWNVKRPTNPQIRGWTL
jgi:stearoyl-CoA desaturase (Delta-9 desaturase)